ncbi:hypothetical protein HQ524_01990, partial [Candidatus Uhrbacteria bacterium]|nr:hypothetical protein [Candidatus Uhrbacteria bacterium]
QLDTLVELAGLNIEPEEKEKLQKDMESILEYVEQLQDMEIENKPFARNVIEGDNHREDVVVPASESERSAVLGNFPAITEDDLLIAHGVLEHKL